MKRGIWTLDDIRGRCVMNDETGCWLWTGAMTLSRGRKANGVRFETPTCAVPRGAFGNDKHMTMPALRYAWMLAGHEVKPENIVYRSHCSDHRCVNPAHAKQATRGQAAKEIKASGRLRGDPHRHKVNLLSAIKSAIPADEVRQIEASYAEGLTQGEVRKRHGIGQKAAKAIRLGVHLHSASRQVVVKQASVFTWRPQ